MTAQAAPDTINRMVTYALGAGIFAGAASMRILDALLPKIAGDFGQSMGATGIAVTAYALSYSGCTLVYGPLSDRYGPYKVITLAAFFSAIASMGCVAAATLEWLTAMRLIAGSVAAAIGPLTLAWIGAATSAQERPVFIANLTGASILGAMVGQFGGGMIGAFFDWRLSFFVIAIVFALAGAALARAGAAHPHYRLIGRRDETAPQKKTAGFLQILRRRAVLLVLAGVGVEGMAIYMSFTYVAALLENRFPLGLGAIGALISLFGVGGLLFVLLVKFFVRNLSEKHRALLGGCSLGGGFATLMLTPSLFLTALAMTVLGFGFLMMHNILQVRATQMAPMSQGRALSLFAATFFAAQAVGAVIGGWSFDHLGPSVSFGASAIVLTFLGLAVAASPGSSESSAAHDNNAGSSSDI